MMTKKARFAAVRASCQKGHIPCRSARFSSSCARETNQSAVRMSLKSVCWEESLTSSSSKAIPPRIASTTILRASQPRKQVQVFRKSQELVCGRTIHCERPSACRWHVSQVVARLSGQSRFANFHKSSGYGTPSTCRFCQPEARECLAR